jgi:RNA polymerase sigma factor (sigma-70 family)
MDSTLEQLVQQAQSGDKSALEHIVEQIQTKIYGLALRMLWHPEDARDATQEILIRIITRLGSFHGESKFTTWAYKVAAISRSLERNPQARRRPKSRRTVSVASGICCS